MPDPEGNDLKSERTRRFLEWSLAGIGLVSIGSIWFKIAQTEDNESFFQVGTGAAATLAILAVLAYLAIVLKTGMIIRFFNTKTGKQILTGLVTWGSTAIGFLIVGSCVSSTNNPEIPAGFSIGAVPVILGTILVVLFAFTVARWSRDISRIRERLSECETVLDEDDPATSTSLEDSHGQAE